MWVISWIRVPSISVSSESPDEVDCPFSLRTSMRHGKRMNMWGDIVLKHPEIIPEIPADMVLLNWDYSPNGRMMLQTDRFSDAGLPLVCCPGTNGWQSHGTRLGQGMADIAQFARIAIEHGAEGLLNTDWGDAGHRNTLGVSLLGIAYGAAYSWSQKQSADRPDNTPGQRETASEMSAEAVVIKEVRGRYLDTMGGRFVTGQDRAPFTE